MDVPQGVIKDGWMDGLECAILPIRIIIIGKGIVLNILYSKSSYSFLIPLLEFDTCTQNFLFNSTLRSS